MKKYFLTGLIIFLPIALTLWIVKFLVDILTAPFFGAIHHFFDKYKEHFPYLSEHDQLALFLSRVIVLISLCIFITILGFFARKFFIGYCIDLSHKLMLRIPIVKKIYKVIVDITKTFIPDDGKNIFETTVVIPFPSKDSYALGFQTGKIPDEAREKGGLNQDNIEYKTIFVPTSPHPISGFLLMMNKDEVKKVDVTTEEAFKFLISSGLFYPAEKNKKPPTT